MNENAVMVESYSQTKAMYSERNKSHGYFAHHSPTQTSLGLNLGPPLY